MGVSLSENTFDGSCTYFNKLRCFIAKLAGYEIKTIEYTFCKTSCIDLDYSKYSKKNYFGDWDKIPEDPLIILFVHSDCDGFFRHTYCEILAKSLEDILEKSENSMVHFIDPAFEYH
jgi:hypothetical protein